MIFMSSPRIGDSISPVKRLANKTKNEESKSYYSTIKPIVFLGGFFAILPMSSSLMKYRWLSFRVLYTFLTIMIMILVFTTTVQSIFKAVMSNMSYDAKDMTGMLAGLVFRTSAVFSLCFFWFVATRFSALMKMWDETSHRLIKYVDFKNRQLHYPRKYAALITLILFSSAFLDRALHDARFVNTGEMCANVTTDLVIRDYADCYLLKNGEYLINVLGFNKVATVVALMINIFTTFTWNFLDLFIIVISCGLYHNFVHINLSLEQNKRVRFRADEWRILREDHLAIANLVENVDKVLSLGILYCYAANLISICTQMFLGLRPKNLTIFETSYTTVSFLHLVGRTAAVTWTASRIHDAFQIPLKYIHACSSSSYCAETKRFRAHIVETPSCLSGCRFFYITRSFFLGIVSVVITYEIIFLELK